MQSLSCLYPLFTALLFIYESLPAEIYDRAAYMLRRIIPVAERCGVQVHDIIPAFCAQLHRDSV